MGYGYYLVNGKECGYAVLDVCNHPDCDEQIDRGLAYACGGEPGEAEDYCDGYFCDKHLYLGASRDWKALCVDCAARVEDEDENGEVLYSFHDGNEVYLDPEFEKMVMARIQDTGVDGTWNARITKKQKWFKTILIALHRSGYRIVPREYETVLPE